jgi:hypothetical protein
MGIVRFALRFPYTVYVLTALIPFLGVASSDLTLPPSRETADPSATTAPRPRQF